MTKPKTVVELAALRARGSITAAEFEAAKDELLNAVPKIGKSDRATIQPSVPERGTNLRRFDGLQTVVKSSSDDGKSRSLVGQLFVVAVIFLLPLSILLPGHIKSSPSNNSENPGLPQAPQAVLDEPKAGRVRRAPAAVQEECASSVLTIARLTGGVMGKTSGLDSIEVKHPAATEIDVFCPSQFGSEPMLANGSVSSISIFSRSPVPADSYFNFIAISGSFLTGLPREKIFSEARGCLIQATSAADGMAYRNIGKFGMMCDDGPRMGRAYDVAIQAPFPEEMVKSK